MNKTKNPLLDDPKNNEYIFKEMLKKFRPELYVLGELLIETGVSYYILLKVIRHLAMINGGTGHGKITLEIANHMVCYISGDERDKLMEPITKQIKEETNI